MFVYLIYLLICRSYLSYLARLFRCVIRFARTHANMSGVVEDVSWRALALISARSVDADAIEAHVRS